MIRSACLVASAAVMGLKPCSTASLWLCVPGSSATIDLDAAVAQVLGVGVALASRSR